MSRCGLCCEVDIQSNQGAAWQSDPTPVGTDPPGGPTCPRGPGADEMKKNCFSSALSLAAPPQG